jgi:glycosyltransferase involved in cell wall biosynthesis
MRIALLGTRGIPANYGGFETFAEELSIRLVQRGHSVTVYCREKYPQPLYRGVKVIYLPSIHNKYLNTLAHSLISTLYLLGNRVDVVLYCNAANAIFTILPRVMGMPVALNVDGIERKRKKWNALARTWYLMSERLATLFPTEIVTDAEVIEAYYLNEYKKRSTFIAYGADMIREESTQALDRLGLEKKGYFLYVSRMEPENHALQVRQAFEKVPTKLKLALIGTAPHAEEYIRQVRDTKDPRVIMPGAIFGKGYRELGSHCFAYIHATEVGGTHPALIEAMGRGALVIYRNTPENAEVCGDTGLPFNDENQLVSRIREAIAMSESDRARFGERAEVRAKARYDWELVTTQYEELFKRLGNANLG